MDNTTFPIPTLPENGSWGSDCIVCDAAFVETFSLGYFDYCGECYKLQKLASAINKHIQDSNGGDSPDLELSDIIMTRCTECTTEHVVSCLSVPGKVDNYFCHSCAVREFCTAEECVATATKSAGKKHYN